MASKIAPGSLVVFVFFADPEKGSLNFILQNLAFKHLKHLSLQLLTT